MVEAYSQKRKDDSLGDIRVLIDALVLELGYDLKTHYSDSEIATLDSIKDNNIHRHFIVSHSQGNFFADEICKDAKVKPELHSFATPVVNKPSCEKAYYTFNGDFIEAVGRKGNFDYRKNLLEYAATGKLGIKVLDKAKDLVFAAYIHQFAKYISTSQKTHSAFISNLPTKDEYKKVVIENIKVVSMLGSTTSTLNRSNVVKSLTCEDITNNFVNLVTPTIKPEQLTGFRYLIKMPGAKAVFLRSANQSIPYYALSIQTSDDSGEKYIIKDAGTAPLFGLGGD